ncbi:hypothetical protein FI667_g14723, partial [Globisporangium splendens]
MARSTRMMECERGEGDSSDGVEKGYPCSLSPCDGDTAVGSGYEDKGGAPTAKPRRSGRSALKRTMKHDLSNSLYAPAPSRGSVSSRLKAAKTRSKREAVAKRELDKAKNCMKQKRCYYRKQVRVFSFGRFGEEERIKMLRAEKQALQQQYARLLEANPEMHPTRFLSLVQHPDEDDTGAETKPKREKVEAITDLKFVEFYLREQNHWYSQTLDKPEERTEKFLNALLPELESLALSSTSRRRKYQQLLQTEHQLATRSLLSSTTRLTANDYRLLLYEVQHRISKLVQNEHFRSFQRTAGGWEASRSVDGALFQWSMRKRMCGHSADEVAQNTWKILTDPERLEKLCPPHVCMTCRVVHVVDSNNVVLLLQFHRMVTECGAAREPLTATTPDATALSLVSFCKTERGFITIMRGLPRESKGVLEATLPSTTIQTDSSCEVWTDVFCWMENEYEGEHTLCKFSGSAPIIGSNASSWNLEVLILAVKWENMVLGTELSALASSNSTRLPDLGCTPLPDTVCTQLRLSNAEVQSLRHLNLMYRSSHSPSPVAPEHVCTPSTRYTRTRSQLHRRISSTHVQMELARSVAIITGAAGGFGKAFADTILADGGKVLITDINTEGVEATAKVLADKYGAKRVSWIRQDVTDTDSFGAAFDHARTHFDDAPVNMLVNNAGIGADLTFYNDGAPTNWSRVVEINFVAVMRGTQVAVDHFKKLLPPGKEGVVVNVASIAGLYAVPLLPDIAAMPQTAHRSVHTWHSESLSIADFGNAVSTASFLSCGTSHIIVINPFSTLKNGNSESVFARDVVVARRPGVNALLSARRPCPRILSRLPCRHRKATGYTDTPSPLRRCCRLHRARTPSCASNAPCSLLQLLARSHGPFESKEGKNLRILLLMASPPLLPPPPSCMEHMRGKLLLLDTTSTSSDSPSSSSSFAVGADAGAASSPVASCSLDDELQTRFVFPSDAKRAKHRILVKRAYHQKLNALSELRKLEKTLQTQYQTLLQRVSVQFEVQVARGEVDFEQGDPTGGLSVLRDLYVRLTRIKDELQKENRALRKLSREHERFHTRLEHVVFADQRTGVLEKQRQQGIDSMYATIIPMDQESCDEVIRRAYKSVLAFRESKNVLTLGSEVFGWSHKYRFENDDCHLQYSISKTFPSLSAFELLQRSWEIMTSEKSYQELHSTSLTSHLHLIQKLNDDNLVFCRVMRRNHQKTLLKTLLVASRFQVENGFIAVFRSIDHSRILHQNVADEQDEQDEEPYRVVWLDMFAWTLFEDMDDGSVRFEFGGKMPHHSSDNAHFWMMEVLLMVLRWENKAVGPIFTLTRG